MSTIQTIEISKVAVPLGQKLLIFGWGDPFINKANREIQAGQITVVDREICHQTFTDRFCAGPDFFGGCSGFDGGAVVNKNTLFGLIDYRSTDYCDESFQGHLYVDITKYREWIDKASDAQAYFIRLSTIMITVVLVLIFN